MSIPSEAPRRGENQAELECQHGRLGLPGFRRRAALPVEAGPPLALPAREETCAPEAWSRPTAVPPRRWGHAGTKIRAKALKVLVWRKENEAQGLSFRGTGKGFWRKKRALPPKVPLSARKCCGLLAQRNPKNAPMPLERRVCVSQNAEGFGWSPCGRDDRPCSCAES
jgi:hypothetical protein